MSSPQHHQEHRLAQHISDFERQPTNASFVARIAIEFACDWEDNAIVMRPDWVLYCMDTLSEPSRFREMIWRSMAVWWTMAQKRQGLAWRYLHAPIPSHQKALIEYSYINALGQQWLWKKQDNPNQISEHEKKNVASALQNWSRYITNDDRRIEMLSRILEEEPWRLQWARSQEIAPESITLSM